MTDGKVASADLSVAQHSTDLASSTEFLNSGDFFTSGDFSSSFPTGSTMALQIPDPVAEAAASLEASFGNEGFCEEFTDLTDFLLQVGHKVAVF